MNKKIKEAVDSRMPDKESIRSNAMSEKKKHIPKRVYAVAAVVLILAVCSVAAVPLLVNRAEPAPVQKNSISADNTLQNEIEETKEGIYIPKTEIKVPESGVIADMLGFVVYGGRVYTQAEYIFCDYDEKPKYMGEYLGTAKGNYDDCCIVVPGEEHEPIDLTADFTSNVTGEVYTVKGYSPAFRICIPEMYEGCGFIAFFECVNDITLATGEDLYGSQRLNIKDNYDKVYYACSDEYGNLYEDKIKRQELSKDAMNVFSEFVDKLMDSEFTEYELEPGEVFYRKEFKSLHIKMKDGSTVEIVLLSGGYVDYTYMYGYVMVKVEDPIFDEFYDMLT